MQEPFAHPSHLFPHCGEGLVIKFEGGIEVSYSIPDWEERVARNDTAMWRRVVPKPGAEVSWQVRNPRDEDWRTVTKGEFEPIEGQVAESSRHADYHCEVCGVSFDFREFTGE